jgi:hypothetical protein
MAVMPKMPSTLTVATLAAAPARSEPTRARSTWRTHVVAGAVGIAAIGIISGIALRAPVESKRTPAPPTPPSASSAPVTGVRFAPLSPSQANSSGGHSPTVATEPASTVAGESGERSAEAPRNPASRRSAAPAAPAAQGVVGLAVAPWGTVYVNGESRGTTPPLTELTLPAGRYLIEIRNGEQAPYVAQVDVKPDQPQQVRHRFQ